MILENLKFTYDSYVNIIDSLRNNGYVPAKYDNWSKYQYPVILRHDIDTDISKAVYLAKLEHDIGVSSTYFVLLTSDFYNVASKKSLINLRQIIDYGHTIGLHFDELAYPEITGNPKGVMHKIEFETKILSGLLEYPIKTVSYHRPSKEILNAELEIPGVINSYGYVFFHDFKYLSDSRRRWREPALEIIKSHEYPRLHILTHAFWYNTEEQDIHDSVSNFINDGNKLRWKVMRENITDLESIMPKEEIR